MRIIKLFILASSMIALISCSSSSDPLMEDSTIDNPLFDNGSRSDTTKNNNTSENDTTGGGMGAYITDWGDGGTEDITMTPD